MMFDNIVKYIMSINYGNVVTYYISELSESGGGNLCCFCQFQGINECDTSQRLFSLTY